MPEAALDNWQPVWNAQVSISTPVCVNFEERPGAGDIHICWFNFNALAQGNAYKPTKEPINYRGPGGDRTHDLQTEATPLAASCPTRTLHATEIASKNATPKVINCCRGTCCPKWPRAFKVAPKCWGNFGRQYFSCLIYIEFYVIQSQFEKYCKIK